MHLKLKEWGEACEVWDEVFASLPPLSERSDNEQGALSFLTRLTAALVGAGEYTRAEPLLRHQLDWHTHRHGKAHETTLDTVDCLGDALHGQGRGEERLELLESVYQRLFAMADVAPFLRVRSGVSLLGCLDQLQPPFACDRSMALGRQLLKDIRAAKAQGVIMQGSQDAELPTPIPISCPEVKIGLSLLGQLKQHGKHEEVVEVAQHLLSVLQAEQGQGTDCREAIADVQTWLAEAMHAGGRTRDALDMYSACLANWLAIKGPLCSEALDIHTAMGGCAASMRDWGAAVQHFRATSDGWRRRGEAFMDRAMWAAENLGICLASIGEEAEAEGLLRWAVTDAQTCIHRQHASAANTPILYTLHGLPLRCLLTPCQPAQNALASLLRLHAGNGSACEQLMSEPCVHLPSIA